MLKSYPQKRNFIQLLWTFSYTQLFVYIVIMRGSYKYIYPKGLKKSILQQFLCLS